MSASIEPESCPACGTFHFANCAGCETCWKGYRRRQIRDSQRRHRESDPHHAARVDRAADLWRRWRAGDLLPLIALHVATRTWWTITSRRHDVIGVTPYIIDRVFPGFAAALDAFPTTATLLVITRAPLRLTHFPFAQCREDHTAVDVLIRLAAGTPMKSKTDGRPAHQVTEIHGGCQSCTALMRTVNVRIQPIGGEVSRAPRRTPVRRPATASGDDTAR
ncbi:hypothetical protein KF840_19360 [bacterium]|nr:hypothetical protein [bacterium]